MIDQPLGRTVCVFATAGILAVCPPSYAQMQQDNKINPFDRFDSNNDGELSKQELKVPSRVFDDMDANKDGRVNKQEMAAFHRNRASGSEKPVADQKKDKEPYPKLIVSKYEKDKAWPGNVIFADKNRNRVVEAGLDGKIVWECAPPEATSCSLMNKSCGSRLSDVELLPNDNVLVLNGGDGVYEINRKGEIVWSYHNANASHDADRLSNGNTIMACVGAEQTSAFPYNDPQAIEVTQKGDIVWAWHAKKEYADSKYKNVRSKDSDDWTHMNSVQRLKDGLTLLSVRNWNLLIAVDSSGKTVWKTGAKEPPQQGWGRQSPQCPHTPVMLDNGNIIVSEPIEGRAIEWDPKQEKVVWIHPAKNWRQGGPYYFVRAAHRLPNGNTFLIDSLGQFVEVTPSGEIVWQARLVDYISRNTPPEQGEIRKAPCFNADRRGMSYYGGR